MKKKEYWVGYYVNSLMHMDNRTFNRVESTHANIKRNNKTASRQMSTVTNKINQWIESRVRKTQCFISKNGHFNTFYIYYTKSAIEIYRHQEKQCLSILCV